MEKDWTKWPTAWRHFVMGNYKRKARLLKSLLSLLNVWRHRNIGGFINLSKWRHSVSPTADPQYWQNKPQYPNQCVVWVKFDNTSAVWSITGFRLYIPAPAACLTLVDSHNRLKHSGRFRHNRNKKVQQPSKLMFIISMLPWIFSPYFSNEKQIFKKNK